MTPFLEVKDMRKSYGAITAVDGVTLSVGPGEIVGVIGAGLFVRFDGVF